MQGLSHLPGWAEKNFQVLGKAFEIIKQVSEAESGFGKKDAFVAVTGLVAKLSDTKLKAPACEALSALAETVGPQFVCAQVHKQAAAQKNPKVFHSPLYPPISKKEEVWEYLPCSLVGICSAGL